ncbi:HCP-like protein [Hirsutella rhossiliensis]|uniref:HCP-like protein n=1 Tax=Hirsutella rhossiliensis TaxID=111463 RepID=A0A9P8MRJ9_9HYPO|nr:HCP-like protein [Hirsutella rhossiliensis]KAH0960943.1 HCP-like protein [Hirsutella rhossiliensis]
MGLGDFLKKRQQLGEGPAEQEAMTKLSGPEFTFIRSDTLSQDILEPPGDNLQPATAATPNRSPRRSLDVFRPRSPSVSSQASCQSPTKRRLSQRLRLSRQPASSENVPDNLPTIVVPAADGRDRDRAESQWERRATMLAGQNGLARSRPPTPVSAEPAANPGQKGRPSPVSSHVIDQGIQEAIRLHEAGHLEKSTVAFARLADPAGANNPLSQVLYGLALRHGWGCAPDPEAAVRYLSAAASNAAAIEQMALQAGLKKGGAAKGELVLAIFELANCFRHGWGIPKDAIAAKQYYETAANLGDTDAMNEVAWCYLEGFGCKKDKFAAARYYRLAEKAGSKTLGNSWIWKDKYDPPGEAGSSRK